MQRLIPVFYSDYGRYINRFRSIPYLIDGLMPVERRILLTLHETSPKNSNKTIKSARVVGDAIGKYHPHGDVACYGTLVNLAHDGFVETQGAWGSPGLRDAPASAMRYTECRIKEWLNVLAFTNIEFVPWETFELEPEPLFLPSPIPIGLIGNGVITGITFYRTLIPKFKLSDLAKRLFWLLETKIDIADKGPLIQPNFIGCKLYETSPDSFEQLLTTGVASIKVIPDGKLEPKSIKILGRAPNASFNSLIEDAKESGLYSVRCASGSTIDVVIEPRKRDINLNELAQTIWNKHLIKKHNYNSLYTDLEGNLHTISIDQLLLNSYNAWKYTCYLKKINEYHKINEKKIELLIIQIIRWIFDQYKCKTVSEILEKFTEFITQQGIEVLPVELEEFKLEDKQWYKFTREISVVDVKHVCSNKSIRSLIENEIDMSKIDTELKEKRDEINTLNHYCLTFVQKLSALNI
jgi:DNA gyrase/topoisomerase IV subunit A